MLHKNKITYVLIILIFTGVQSFGAGSGKYFSPHDSTGLVCFGYNPKKIIVIGMETAGSGFNYKDTATWEKKYARWMRFEPNMSWYTKYNLGIGLRARIEFFRSNIKPDKPDVFEFGGFVRYYYPIYSKKRFLRNILLFTEFAVSVANYHYIDKFTTTIFHNEFDQMVIRIPFGFSFSIWKGFNIQISPRFEHFINEYTRVDLALGFSYHFNRK